MPTDTETVLFKSTALFSIPLYLFPAVGDTILFLDMSVLVYGFRCYTKSSESNR